MRITKFEYLTPSSLEEACLVLQQHGSQAAVLAGGTDLLVKMKNPRHSHPQYVVSLKNIQGLEYIRRDKDMLRIGALTKLDAVANSEVIKTAYSSLAFAADNMATPQIRNIGTIAGNLCNAARSADMAPPLMALEALLNIVSPQGTRTIPVDSFFAGQGKNTLRSGEIVTEVVIPLPPARFALWYQKFSPRSARDIAAVGVAVALRLDSGGKCEKCRIFLGAVADTPIRAPLSEAVITGNKIDEVLAAAAGKQAVSECRPIDDNRATADYRRHIVGVVTKDAILEAYRGVVA